MSSNWRSTQVADEYLERYGVPVIAEMDTRAVVRHLRANGVMRGVIASTARIWMPRRWWRRRGRSGRWMARILPAW